MITMKMLGTYNTITLQFFVSDGELVKSELYSHDKLGNLLSRVNKILREGLVQKIVMEYNFGGLVREFVYEHFTNDIYLPVKGAKEAINLNGLATKKTYIKPNLGLHIEINLKVHPYNLNNRLSIEADVPQTVVYHKVNENE